MKKTFRNLLLAGLFLFAVSFDSFTLGVAYDEKYDLYPETDFTGCMMMEVYGKRWERLGQLSLFIGTTLGLSAVIMWRRKREREKDAKIRLDGNLYRKN